MHAMPVVSSFAQRDLFSVSTRRLGPSSAPPLQDVGLSISLPRQQYKVQKTVPVPFDIKMSNDGRFETLSGAMLFVAKHCMFHHHQFNRNLARMYLSRCRVLDLLRGGFVTPAHLTKRDFDEAFHQALKAVAD